MSCSKRLASIFCLVALFGFSVVCDAQTFRGGISGRVADSTGAVLPGVTVTATNDATSVSRTTVTSAGGDFSVPDLQLGMYTIEATLQGFQTLRTTVEVSVSQVASVDLKMGLSQVAETITVTASALMLDTVSTSLSNVVRPKQVQDLPLNGRDFRGMMQLAPGVAGTSVNGVRGRGNNFQIDGADNNDAFQNASAINQGGVSGIAGDVANPADRARIVAAVRERGPLHVLVHNAATGVVRPALETSDKHWDWTVNANARALLQLARVAVPQMPSGSSIVAISSLGAQRVLENYSLIGTSKAALEALLARKRGARR